MSPCTLLVSNAPGGGADAIWEIIDQQQKDGGTPRPEFTEGRLKEFGEAALLAARESYEEKKVPFIGKLLGSAPFTGLPVPNLIEGMQLAENLTFRQLCLISICGQRWWKSTARIEPDLQLAIIPLSSQPPEKYMDEHVQGVYSDLNWLIAMRLIPLATAVTRCADAAHGAMRRVCEERATAPSGR